MEKSIHKWTSSSPGSSEGFHGHTRSSFGAFLRSIFSCSGYGVDYDDDPTMHQNQTTKRPVVSLLKAKKQRRSRRSAAKSNQAQQESSIALSTALKKPDADGLHQEPFKKPQPPSFDSVQKIQETPLPNTSEPSAILSESWRGLLCTHLPTLARGREWVLLYSTWKHGISLRTLYRNSTHLSGPFLLDCGDLWHKSIMGSRFLARAASEKQAVQDSEGVALGGLLTGPLDPTKPKFQGTHESFLFTSLSADFTIFGATGYNRYYHLCTNEMLGLGGGRAFALRLDENLMHGSSGLSETFGNSCLSHTEEFNIRHVELWGFAHTSKYVPEKAAYRPPPGDSFGPRSY